MYIPSLLLAVDNPLDNPNDTVRNYIMLGFNIFLTICFTLEMIAKVITHGFLMHEHSYLRSMWNSLDFILVILAIVSLFTDSSQLRNLRVLRTLRALRPLRVINRNEGMKLIVNTLIASVPAVLNVMTVVALFFVIFSILATNFLKGAFYSCSGDEFNALTRAQQYLITYPIPYVNLTAEQQAWSPGPYGDNTPTSEDVCIWLNATWVNTDYQNFDSFFQSFVTFFGMTTIEGWAEIMWQAQDSRGISMQPVRGSNTFAWGVFFVFFMFFVAFILKNLFVGAVCDSFVKIKEDLGGSALLTDSQKEWIETQRVIRAAKKLKPKLTKPKSRFRLKLFDFVTHVKFENAIMTCIILNLIVMSCNMSDEPAGWTITQDFLNYTFSAIFTFEAIFKLIAFGIKQYFSDTWNIFDLFVVIGSNIGIAFALADAGSTFQFGGVLSVVRAFRVFRILRLVKSAKGIQQLFDTMIVSIPSLINILLVFFLVLFMSASIGVEMFAKQMYNGGTINPHANFRTFTRSFITLFRWTTGENWNGMVFEMAKNLPGCVDDPKFDANMCGFNGGVEGIDDCIPLNGCANYYAIFIFSHLFTLFVSFIILNVMVAVILQQFSDSELKENRLSKSLVAICAELWCERDPNATYLLSFEDFSAFLYDLPPPLCKENMSKKEHRKMLLSLCTYFKLFYSSSKSSNFVL